VVVLEGARVVQTGRPGDLIDQPGMFARLFAGPAEGVISR
jgi:hypothetical protein